MRYRSIFISDVHLGLSSCKAKELLEFLKNNQCSYLYLVGDIIDTWVLNSWLVEHNTVLQKLLKLARNGTQIIFIPGNHDSQFRKYDGMNFGDILILNEAYYYSLSGKRFYILHGDELDFITKNYYWISYLGSLIFDLALYLNPKIHYLRNLLGLKSYWSLSNFLKENAKNITKFVSNYERNIVNLAISKNADGVICGHIHHPILKEIDGIIYGNTGDWVESNSAIVEDFDGKFELIHYKTKIFDEEHFNAVNNFPMN